MRVAEITHRDRVILVLAVAGGSLDVVILRVFGVLTAAQTGNTAILAISLAQSKLTIGLLSVVGYVVGAGVAELIMLESHNDTSPSRMSGCR